MILSSVLLLLLTASQRPAVDAESPAPAAAGSPAAADRGYRIGPGDILRVAVYGYDDLSQIVVVQPAGSFVFPLIGAVDAAQATPVEVEARIAGRLAKGFIREPKVSVVVQEYRSQVVFVMGEVTRPGSYPMTGETRVVEILSRAGPLSANAGSEALVIRGGPRPVDAPGGEAAAAASGAEVLRVDLREIQAGRLATNVLLKPNDTLLVPQAPRVFVSGEVRNPGAFAYSGGLTVRQAVSLAGGFTADAATRNARVIREVAGKTRTLKLKLDEPLLPRDTVVIGTRLF